MSGIVGSDSIQSGFPMALPAEPPAAYPTAPPRADRGAPPTDVGPTEPGIDDPGYKADGLLLNAPRPPAKPAAPTPAPSNWLHMLGAGAVVVPCPVVVPPMAPDRP